MSDLSVSVRIITVNNADSLSIIISNCHFDYKFTIYDMNSIPLTQWNTLFNPRAFLEFSNNGCANYIAVKNGKITFNSIGCDINASQTFTCAADDVLPQLRHVFSTM